MGTPFDSQEAPMNRSKALVCLVGSAMFAAACAAPPPKAPIQGAVLVPSASEEVAVDQLIVLVDASSSVDARSEFRDEKALVESFARTAPEGDYQTGGITFGGFRRDTDPLTRFDRKQLVSEATSIEHLAEGTPIHKAIAEAGDQLKGKQGRAAIVLYSDGLITDEIGREIEPQLAFDALAAARKSYSGTICVHTVQTGSDPAGAEFLRKLASTNSCGSYRAASGVTTIASLHQLERDVLLGKATPDVAAAPSDRDGDGVIDARDACPGTPRGAPVDARGCWVVKGLQFAHDSSRIDAKGEAALDEVAGVLKKNPELRVQLDGHTDSDGSDAYNQGLSQRRADAARSYLAGHGIEGNRVSARGFGESQPATDNDTAEGKATNRRTEVEVVE
jgi:OOP family OmpA-OmpF porin